MTYEETIIQRAGEPAPEMTREEIVEEIRLELQTLGEQLEEWSKENMERAREMNEANMRVVKAIAAFVKNIPEF